MLNLIGQYLLIKLLTSTLSAVYQMNNVLSHYLKVFYDGRSISLEDYYEIYKEAYLKIHEESKLKRFRFIPGLDLIITIYWNYSLQKEIKGDSKLFEKSRGLAYLEQMKVEDLKKEAILARLIELNKISTIAYEPEKVVAKVIDREVPLTRFEFRGEYSLDEVLYLSLLAKYNIKLVRWYGMYYAIFDSYSDEDIEIFLPNFEELDEDAITTEKFRIIACNQLDENELNYAITCLTEHRFEKGRAIEIDATILDDEVKLKRTL